MLATLNLQLVPVTLSDETPGTSNTGDEGQSAFNDLLQFSAEPGGDPGGGLLPDGGNEMPPTPKIRPAEDVAIAADIGTALEDTLVDGESTGIQLDLSVDYPDGDLAISGLHEVSMLPIPNAAILEHASRRNISAPVVEKSPYAPDGVKLLPALAAENIDLDTVSRPREAIEVLPPGLVTARGKGRQPSTLPAGFAAAATDDASERLELPRLPETAAFRSQGATDVVAAGERPLVNQVQPGQAVQAMPNSLVASAAHQVSVESPAPFAAESITETINTPLRDSNWGERIGERVVMMAGKQLRSAEIRLTPADLGPVRVQVSMDEGSTNVSFHAQHALTREALEQALPRLRELLAESGLSLGQASVGDDDVSAGKQDQGSAAESSARAADGTSSEPDHEHSASRQKLVTSNSLIDTFA